MNLGILPMGIMIGEEYIPRGISSYGGFCPSGTLSGGGYWRGVLSSGTGEGVLSGGWLTEGYFPVGGIVWGILSWSYWRRDIFLGIGGGILSGGLAEGYCPANTIWIAFEVMETSVQPIVVSWYQSCDLCLISVSVIVGMTYSLLEQ